MIFKFSNMATRRGSATAVLLIASLLAQPYAASAGDQAPSYDWSGVYAGVLLGYGTGDSAAVSEDGFDGSAPEGRADLSPDGFTGAAVAGYNWQRGQLVYGLEGELGYLGAKDSFWEPDGDDYFGQTEYGLYGSLVGRVGFAVDRTLISAKAGLIVADIDYGYGDTDSDEPDPDGSIFDSGARAGFTVGTSLEHAFTNDWIGRLDYSYSDFGSHDRTDGYDASYEVSDSIHMIRVGIAKKF
ncbi:outer membrane beta-barrel protein [Aminobacter aminovorans]|uniref:outer membrane protein n=1 Tax=Aminobacter aminovorans TaxID=83263 RepID=UPI00285F087B|nr:outer membrane beta-barrel protein [Aminobacter aminovorans]MDR7220765.1 outer membrane immunogenic protein [Aminobacter aminovorans]